MFCHLLPCSVTRVWDLNAKDWDTRANTGHTGELRPRLLCDSSATSGPVCPASGPHAPTVVPAPSSPAEVDSPASPMPVSDEPGLRS